VAGADLGFQPVAVAFRGEKLTINKKLLYLGVIAPADDVCRVGFGYGSEPDLLAVYNGQILVS